MNAQKRILIGYDGSAGADAAIEDLKRAGLPRNASVLVVTVADVFLPPPAWQELTYEAAVIQAVRKGWDHANQMVDQCKKIAAGAAKRIKASFHSWEVRSEGFADSPSWGIINKAKDWKADLIVVGAHGMASTGRLALGSISQIVATQASCTVRVAHHKPEDLSAPPRIVIGVDGSPCADLAVNEAASREWPEGTAFHLIMAIDPRVKTSVFWPHSKKWVRKEDELEHYWIDRLMEAAADKLRSRGFAATYLNKEGDPKKVVAEEAERWGADCIFVGARGLGGVKYALTGSVSSSVAARAHCTVEIVRAAAEAPRSKQAAADKKKSRVAAR